MSRLLELLKRRARRGVCLLLAAAFAPAFLVAQPPAATNLTVAQLDRLLKQLPAQNDAWAARQITGIRLTERVSAARLAQWEANLAGERSRQALMAVADLSTALPPPAAEIPALPPPDANTQQQILARCMDYIRQRISRLPNYLALRTTTSFAFTTAQALDSVPMVNELFQKKPGEKISHRALGPAKSSDSPDAQYFWLGSYAQDVTYRGSAEVVNAPPGAKGPSRASSDAMTTSGEFGSVLGVVLIDASGDEMPWDHWERGANGSLAVFRYAVPAERSHFAVAYTHDQPVFPAYHGEFAIDPESGAVWRITVLASGSDSGFVAESSMAVEFTPTEIGAVTYICPVRSVAIIRLFDTFEYGNTAHTPVPYQIFINNVAFTNYHLFRSESRILPGTPGP
jgi:hypothetical protein